jgi:nucleoside-diphosphate-sugar epimerase
VGRLLEAGHEVVGYDADLYARCTLAGEIPSVPTIVKDVRDVSRQDVEGYDAILHLAGLSNDPLGDYHPHLTEEINTEASVRMAQFAREAGVPRFIYASSCSVYGASGSAFVTEESPFRPVTPYGESKMRVEQALHNLADERFSPTFLRASTAYGASPRLRFDLVTNNLAAWAFVTGKVFLKSNGTPWRPIVHVEDIVSAYLAVLHAPREQVHEEAFNVGSTTENYQIREIAEMVRDVVPGSEVSFADDAGPDTRCYRVDCNKIARTLHGFKPQWTARRGIEQLYELYRTVALTVEDFEGQRYKRIAHVKHLIEHGLLSEELRWNQQTGEVVKGEDDDVATARQSVSFV